MSTVGNRLAELREAKDWRRTVIAAEFNLSEKTVYRWETGESAIPSDFIPQLAEMLGTTRDHLMGWDQEPASASGKAA